MSEERRNVERLQSMDILFDLQRRMNATKNKVSIIYRDFKIELINTQRNLIKCNKIIAK